MRIALAILLFVHGFAHLPGFVVGWRLGHVKDMPYKTTVLAGSVDIGDLGMRVMGLLWLAAALAVMASGGVVLARLSFWRSLAMAAAASSLVLCAIAWPDSRIGVFVNGVILAFLLLDRQMGWLS